VYIPRSYKHRQEEEVISFFNATGYIKEAFDASYFDEQFKYIMHVHDLKMLYDGG
jgi:hypothetical protein